MTLKEIDAEIRITREIIHNFLPLSSKGSVEGLNASSLRLQAYSTHLQALATLRLSLKED